MPSVHSLGYVLADDPQGETPLIPSEVMEFSIKHSTEVDINTTLQILGSPGEKASSIPGCNRTDSVIRYCYSCVKSWHKALNVLFCTGPPCVGLFVLDAPENRNVHRGIQFFITKICRELFDFWLLVNLASLPNASQSREILIWNEYISSWN